jgi:HEPN domain-containing protein
MINKINKEVRNWLVKALNDFYTAQRLIQLPYDEIITDTLCFHCQQFIEKVLKAYLILNNRDFKKSHDLEYLINLCSNIDNDLESLFNAAKILSDYAIEIRYPDDFYIPSVEEANRCFDIASNVKEFILKKLNITEKEI